MVYKRLLIRLLFSLLVAIPIAVLPGQALAADPVPFYWDFINLDIDVQENGDMLVTETQKYVFTGPHTNERYRWIPLDKVDGIDNVEVYEEGQRLTASTEVEYNQLWIRWSHDLSPPEIHTFVLKYRVRGGLHIYEDGDQVYWKAIFKDRDAPVNSASITIHFPEPVSVGQLSVAGGHTGGDGRCNGRC